MGSPALSRLGKNGRRGGNRRRSYSAPALRSDSPPDAAAASEAAPPVATPPAWRGLAPPDRYSPFCASTAQRKSGSIAPTMNVFLLTGLSTVSLPEQYSTGGVLVNSL
jgi:hypothetical protein